MAKYGSPIICSLGRFDDCDCQRYYPLGDNLTGVKRMALHLMSNPPRLSDCQRYGASRFLDCYPGDDPREFQPGIPMVVEIETGRMIPFTDDDIG